MLRKDDTINTLGLKLGSALKCLKAKEKFLELEK